MLGPMHSFADAVRRLWRRAMPSSAKPTRLVPVLFSALVVAGAAVGAVLATVGGGKPAAVSAPAQPISRASPAPAKTIGPVVPMLGGSADGSGTPLAVPVARAYATASTSSRTARQVPVAPLRGLKQADLLV